MDKPLVSIVITNYNGIEHIQECLNSIYNMNFKNFEILFIDNNSSDNSVSFVKNNFPKVRVIQNRKDLGFTGANNIGASNARGDYIVLLNLDTFVDKNWLKELIIVANQSETIGVIGSKIYYFDNRDLINFAGGNSTKYGDAYHIGIGKNNNLLLNKQMNSFYICGAALLFKKELLNKIGLFDTKYYAFYEDADFCWRTWIYGYDIIFAPKSFIYHKIGGVMKNQEYRLYLTEKNRLRTLLKNYELKTLFKIMPGYYRKRFRKILELKKSKNKMYPQVFLRYSKATLWNFFHIFSLIRNRIRVQVYRKRDDKFLFKLMRELKEFENKLYKLA